MALEDYIIASDQQLIERVLGGDASAFEHLFNRYRDSILQLYLQKTGGNIDDSNDLLQETFVKIYLNLQRYSDQYNGSIPSRAIRLLITYAANGTTPYLSTAFAKQAVFRHGTSPIRRSV